MASQRTTYTVDGNGCLGCLVWLLLVILVAGAIVRAWVWAWPS